MKGRHFSSDAEVIAAAETWLEGQPPELFLSGLQKLEFGRCSLFSLWSGYGLISTPVRLWCSDDEISWLDGWASQWRPPQTQAYAICATFCSYCLIARDGRDSNFATTCRLAGTRRMSQTELCMKYPGTDKYLEGNQCHAL